MTTPKTSEDILAEFDKKFPFINEAHPAVAFFAKDLKPELKSFLLQAMKTAAMAMVVEEIREEDGTPIDCGFNAARQDQLERFNRFFGE